MDDAIPELLVRYWLGEYKARPAVQKRLGEIFRDDPPDAHDLLMKACEYLRVDGSLLKQKVREAGW